MKRLLAMLVYCAAIIVLFSCYAEAAPSRPPTSIQGHFYTGALMEWTMEVSLQPNGVADGYIALEGHQYPDMPPLIYSSHVYAWATDGNSITLFTEGDMNCIFVFSTHKSKEFLKDGSVCTITHGGYSITYSR